MNEELVHALASRRAEIRERWETFLRLEPVASPLVHPDTLAYGIPGALREIIARLWSPSVENPEEHVECACGRNPLQAFYTAGEQAMLEALVLVQATQPALAAGERAATVEELRRAVRFVAHRDIAALAGVCQSARAAAGK
jgi:hypothetical protein